MNAKAQVEAYRQAMGRPATERQLALAAAHFPCCGAERAKGKHAPHCTKGNRAA